MNNCSITSQQHIHIRIGGVKFTKLVVSLLESILIQRDIRIILACSSATSIHIEIQSTPGVSIPNVIFGPG